MNEKKIDPNLVIAVGLLVVVFFGGRKIFQFLGLIDTKDDKEKEAALNEIKNEDFWNYSNYLANAPDGHQIYTAAYTDTLAEKLWDATGWLNDNEEEIYGVFRGLPTKSAMAFLAQRFFVKYDQDLYSYLDEYLNDDEMIRLNTIISPKPEYYA
jgi:hypothetical protein